MINSGEVIEVKSFLSSANKLVIILNNSSTTSHVYSGPDVSILAGPFSKAESAFEKGPARIETSGPLYFKVFKRRGICIDFQGVPVEGHRTKVPPLQMPPSTLHV